MTKRAAIVVGSVMALVLSGAASATTMFQATLTGDQEVPPVATDAFGTASLVLNDDETRLEMTIQLQNLDLDGAQTPDDRTDDVVGLHIHVAPIGLNGPVVFGLINPNSDLNGDLMIDAVAGTVFSAWDEGEGEGTTLSEQLLLLKSQKLYFNVHTPANQAGEIRGQITPEPSTASLIALGLVALSSHRGRSRR